MAAHVTLPQMLMLVVVPALVIILHYDNIQRLLAGKERKIGQKVVTTPVASEHSPL